MKQLATYSRAVINFAADIAHIGAVITHHKHLPTACLVEIAPLGMALLDIFIQIALYFHEMGYCLPFGWRLLLYWIYC